MWLGHISSRRVMREEVREPEEQITQDLEETVKFRFYSEGKESQRQILKSIEIIGLNFFTKILCFIA